MSAVESSATENQHMRKLKSLIQIKDELQKSRRWATVFFADLADSSIYKLLKAPPDAEAKVYFHNVILTEAIFRCKGQVVKYLGDGVMAKFEGDSCEVNAISAAVDAQNVFKVYNEKPQLPDIDKVLTKIGINTGDVSFWQFEGHKEPDPQGTTVDIAARIVALAKPLQVLCSLDVKQRGMNKMQESSFGSPVSRELKGILNPVQICEVKWDGKELGISESVHFSPPNPKIASLIEGARQAQA